MKYQVVNPATGQVEKEYPTATDGEIGEILDRAGRGYPAWRRTPIAERADIVRRVAQLYQDRIAELGAIITREMGKTTAEAEGELEFTVGIYRYYADNGADLLKDEPLHSNTPGTAWVRKSPIGALLGIMPWNYPYYQVARFAAPNLMIGNTIVLKHAPQCPESALAMEQIFHEAGLPADAYINVFASNEQVAGMIADPRIAGVSVTGSERAGSAVAATAGQNLKKVVLELGGSDPFIVLDGADLPSVAKAAAAARMENGGQACNASKRMIVTDDVYDEFISEFTAAMSGYTTGDPTDPAVAYGPLSSEQAARNLMDQINDAVSKGATVHLGREAAGRARRVRRGHRAVRRHPRDARLPRGTVRPGRRGLQGLQRRRGGRAGQQQLLRPRRRRVLQRRGAGPGRGRPAGCRDGLDQPGRGRRPRTALRRDKALRRRP
jgi:succinate-semialdehyde dehydrogenase / glutarate-semialdehyde dehydrogenase